MIQEFDVKSYFLQVFGIFWISDIGTKIPP